MVTQSPQDRVARGVGEIDVGAGAAATAEAPEDPAHVVDAFGRAWAAHDLEAALDMLTEDCVFDSTGPPPDGARHVGREAIAGAWRDIFADPATAFTAEETFAAGDRVVQRWRYTWVGGHVRGVDLFRVRDGRVAEKLSYVKG